MHTLHLVSPCRSPTTHGQSRNFMWLLNTAWFSLPLDGTCLVSISIRLTVTHRSLSKPPLCLSCLATAADWAVGKMNCTMLGNSGDYRDSCSGAQRMIRSSRYRSPIRWTSHADIANFRLESRTLDNWNIFYDQLSINGKRSSICIANNSGNFFMQPKQDLELPFLY